MKEGNGRMKKGEPPMHCIYKTFFLTAWCVHMYIYIYYYAGEVTIKKT